MKTRIFYFSAIGVCALLVVILVIVAFTGNRPAARKERNKRGMQERFHGAMQDRNQRPMQGRNKGPQRGKNLQAKPTAFQFITKKLNKMGITANGVEIDVTTGTVKWNPNSKWGEYYGKPSSNSQPIAPSILQLHQAIKADPKGIRGCYKTKWGLLRLFTNGDIVTGTLNYYGPTLIIGKLKDNILVGIWIKPAHNKRPMLVGPIQFAFAEKWSAFQSVWKFKKEPQYKNKWVGVKTRCPARGEKLTPKLIPGGPGVPSNARPRQQGKPGNPVGGKIPQKSPPSAKQ